MKAGRARLLPGVALVAATAMLAVGAVSGAAQAQIGAADRGDAGARPVTLVVQSDPTPEEQAHLREVAGSIWTPQLAAGWNMNAEVEAVLSHVTGEILECSKAFALVPRPPAFFPGPGYLRSYWKQIRDYFLVVKENRTYRACVVTAAANYRSVIEMASMGI
ncbi:hypothetical protein OG883_10135 [Streptomyces sp. NBC_01142]|uniref:hypothetical protein n=1 Tax=Streptomyces sp. NBC_01142 TaxID=2975865 RepID=UPI0022562DDA|nr:hypothetical protein [Streptomyces sp. NBC_01142]MCX4820257.1 hypothetical protein [Streptomyces sp. NBC_01142]